jgi:predicted transcriptional regulator/GNAT superfamily N-acetyltransferase
VGGDAADGDECGPREPQLNGKPAPGPTLGVAISVHRRYADALFAGVKRVEIRRARIARPVACAFVYEPSPSAFVRGALVISHAERATARELPGKVPEAELVRAADYLAGCHGDDVLYLLHVERPVEFETPLASDPVRRRLRGLQALTYVRPFERLALELLRAHLAGKAPGEPRVLSLHSGGGRDEGAVDQAMVAAIGPYYGELDRGFRQTHLTPVGSLVPSIGFSTLAKVAFAVVDRGEAVGKLVVSMKRGQTLKIAPIYIAAEERCRGLATSAVRRVVERARELGLRQVFTTLPRPHIAARRVFERAGFTRVATLGSHYTAGVDEEVFVNPLTPGGPLEGGASLGQLEGLKGEFASFAEFVQRYFFPVDREWASWLSAEAGSLGEFSGKPHDFLQGEGTSALVIYKRGGTAKVVPAYGAPPTPAFVSRWEAMARQRRRRKVTVFLPAALGPADWLVGYDQEASLGAYGLFGPVNMYSRHLPDP